MIANSAKVGGGTLSLVLYCGPFYGALLLRHPCRPHSVNTLAGLSVGFYFTCNFCDQLARAIGIPEFVIFDQKSL